MSELSAWTVRLHDDGLYLSIKHDNYPGEVLLECPVGWRDLEEVRKFVAALNAASEDD